MPDFLVIVTDGPVSGELEAAGGVDNAHPGPQFPVLVGGCNSLLGIYETAKIGGRHPGVMGAQDRVDNRLEQARLE